MITEKHNHRFDTLLQAIDHIRNEGYTIEFVSNENGFLNPENNKTYLPKSICAVEFIRLYAPHSGPDEDIILYLLETDDGLKGWISDSYSIYANAKLTEHINSIREQFSPTNNEL